MLILPEMARALFLCLENHEYAFNDLNSDKKIDEFFHVFLILK